MEFKAEVKFDQIYIHAKGVVIDFDKLTPAQASELNEAGEVSLPRYEKKKLRKPLVGVVVGKRKIEVTRKLRAYRSGDPDEEDRGVTYPGDRRETYLVAVNMGSIYKVDSDDVEAMF